MHNIYYQECRNKSVPASRDVAKLLSFFNCMAALMTAQLQNLALDSVKDYTNLISQNLVGETMRDVGQYGVCQRSCTNYRLENN